MNNIIEIRRLKAPAPRPQAIVFVGPTLWMSSLTTCRVYEIDVATWTVKSDWQAPGNPWGLTWVGSELRVNCGEGEDDDRIIRKLVPGKGFDPEWALPCPDSEGSQLGWDGKDLHLNQWHRQRVIALGTNGAILREFPVPHQICGQVIVDGVIHVVSTDVEDSLDYWLTRIDPKTGQTTDLAHIPFQARGLAFDRKHFWTNHREQHEIVCFERPA